MVPGLLGLMGGTSAGLAIAPALRVLTWPLLAVTVVMLTRGWYVALAHRGWRSPIARRAMVVLAVSTAGSGALWALRFAGIFGSSPL